jgi:hypothetical protein
MNEIFIIHVDEPNIVEQLSLSNRPVSETQYMDGVRDVIWQNYSPLIFCNSVLSSMAALRRLMIYPLI